VLQAGVAGESQLQQGVNRLRRRGREIDADRFVQAAEVEGIQILVVRLHDRVAAERIRAAEDVSVAARAANQDVVATVAGDGIRIGRADQVLNAGRIRKQY